MDARADSPAQLDLAHFRRLLEAERARVLDSLESLNHTQALTDETGDLATGPGDHLADTASETYLRELDESLEEQAELLLSEIEDALRRIDEGSYGVCAACGRPIAPERLEAVPWAKLCLEDKRAEERR
ncbi:MAG TPA: TraR/DksA C4-type zinc finger protein [Gaiellaceae bacterium]|nr:TraR/DksA C4-type zinc finger protein [Gaiellaceae bacterium]